MSGLSFAIDTAAAERALDALPSVASAVMREEIANLGDAYRDALKAVTPRGRGERSPNLVNRYETNAAYSQATAEYTIKNEAPQLKYVLQGRGPVHAKPGKMLRFVIDGRVFFRVSVKGAKANPFDKRVKADMRGRVRQTADRIRSSIVARLGQ